MMQFLSSFIGGHFRLFGILFLIGTLMIAVGFIGNLKTRGMEYADYNVASAFALIVIYAGMFLFISSPSGVSSAFDAICGGIPFLSELTDYGSLKNVLSNNPVSALTAFFDTVILSLLIDVLSRLLMLNRDKFSKTLFTAETLLKCVIIALVSLLILNFVVKKSAIYIWITAGVGGIIASFSVITGSFAVLSMINPSLITRAGVLGILAAVSLCQPAGIIRGAFLKAFIYVLGIWLLESQFGSLANGVSVIVNLLVAFVPVVILLLGLFIMVRSVFR